MIKMTHLLLACAVAFVLPVSGRAQDAPLPPAAAPAPTVERFAEAAPRIDPVFTEDPLPQALPGSSASRRLTEVLQGLPKPRDVPASLLAPAVPPATRFIATDIPYFTVDPLLDDPVFGPPGWFAGAEIQILKPHIIPGNLGSIVANRAGQATHVQLPIAQYDWTVSPRIFLGYRLPAGFGEFMVAYRHLGSVGSSTVLGANGASPSALHSGLTFDMLDFDYNSRELSFGPMCDMKWTVGIRTLFLFYDSQQSQSLSQAAAGNGVIDARAANHLFGGGPHSALELSRHLANSGWSLFLRTDIAILFDGVHEDFAARSTTLSAAGRHLIGAANGNGLQGSPDINFRAGVTWQPAPTSPLRFFMGYQIEQFWALNKLSSFASDRSTGQLFDQGLVLQATYRY